MARPAGYVLHCTALALHYTVMGCSVNILNITGLDTTEPGDMWLIHKIIHYTFRRGHLEHHNMLVLCVSDSILWKYFISLQRLKWFPLSWCDETAVCVMRSECVCWDVISPWLLPLALQTSPLSPSGQAGEYMPQRWLWHDPSFMIFYIKSLHFSIKLISSTSFTKNLKKKI